MAYRLSAILATFVLGAAAIGAGPAAAGYQKVASAGTTFKNQYGYITQCQGTTCKAVYTRTKDGKFEKLAADKGKLKQTGRQVQVCYDGSHNATVCYWVYSD
jgi:hypothetical protein